MEVSGQRHAPAALYPRGQDPRYPLSKRAGWDPEPVWTERLEEKSSASVGDRTPVVQSVVRHYTDWATPAPVFQQTQWKSWTLRCPLENLWVILKCEKVWAERLLTVEADYTPPLQLTKTVRCASNSQAGRLRYTWEGVINVTDNYTTPFESRITPTYPVWYHSLGYEPVWYHSLGYEPVWYHSLGYEPGLRWHTRN
jgi:hypothetical protein